MVFLCLTTELCINFFATFLQLHFYAVVILYADFIPVPYLFWGRINIKKDDILHLIVDKTMETVEMVAMLFKLMLLSIRVSVTVIARKQNINANSSTKAELIVANDAMPQMLWTRYFYQIPIFYYQQECSFQI